MLLVIGVVVAVLVWAVGFGPAKSLLRGDRPIPTAEQVQSAFSVPSGYTLQAAPPEVAAQMQTEIAADEELKDVIGPFDVKQIMQGPSLVGAIVILAVDPDEIDPADVSDFAEGAGVPMGITFTQETIGETNAFVGSQSGAGAAVIFDEDGFFIVVAAQGPDLARQLMTHLEETNRLASL